ncbi:unnamed protein product, partial [Ectocarpus sp. 6 AP-2014]
HLPWFKGSRETHKQPGGSCTPNKLVLLFIFAARAISQAMGFSGQRSSRKMKLAPALAMILAARFAEGARTIEISDVSGSSNADAPNTIQMAIDTAEPGDTILLAPGMYYEDIKSSRDGTEDAPITIKGPRSAVVRGDGGMNVVSITHHHVRLEGFSIDGSGGENEDNSDLDPDKFHRNLLHVHGDRRVEMTSFHGHKHRSGVTGFKGSKLNLSHARCSCVMLSDFVTHAELRDNDISDCGITSTGCRAGGGGGGGESGSIGQGLEVGTPTAEVMADFDGVVDETAWNKVVGNSFSTIGGACGVVHQGARFNLLDGNTCTGSRDADGAGFVLLGDVNTFRNNYVTGGSGAGLAVGGTNYDPEVHKYGVFNQVDRNQLQTNAGGSLLDGALPQPSGEVCQNSVEESAPQSLAKECSMNNSRDNELGKTTSTRGVSMSKDDNLFYAARFEREATAGGEVVRGGTAAPRCKYLAVPRYHVAPCELSDIMDETGPTGTHWSRNGDNSCLEFTLADDSVVGPPTVVAVEITFNHGADRVTYFEASGGTAR